MFPPKRFLLILLLFLPLSGWSQGLLSFDRVLAFLEKDQRETLWEEGELTQFHFDNFIPAYIPDIPLREELEEVLGREELNMGIEGLFFYRDFDWEAYKKDPQGELLRMYNTLRAVSRLEGTEYYSASREKMRTFFSESWVIADLESPKERLPDPLVEKIPPRDTILIHQRDLSFKNHESTMDFVYREPLIWVYIINQTTLFYDGWLRAVGKGRMQIHLTVVPTEEGLLLYGITAARAINVGVFKKRANASFYNRLRALSDWYLGELERRDE